MANEYLIQKSTLDEIASQSMNLVGKTEAVSTAEIIGDLTDVNTEVGSQADLIAQIKSTVDNLPEAGSGTLNLQDKTVTPTVSTQTITADSGYDGLDIVTVNGDSNLVAGNIKSGVSIFGVSGNYEGVSSGGGSVNAGEWIHVASLPTTYYAEPEGITYYLEIPSNTICLLIIKDGNYYPYWRESLTSNNILWRYTCLVTASFIESDGSLFFQMTTYATGEDMYVLPIYAK